MAEPALALKGLAKSFGEVRAVVDPEQDGGILDREARDRLGSNIPNLS